MSEAATWTCPNCFGYSIRVIEPDRRICPDTGYCDDAVVAECLTCQYSSDVDEFMEHESAIEALRRNPSIDADTARAMIMAEVQLADDNAVERLLADCVKEES